MTIVLNHTIIRARDKARSAAFFAELLGLEPGEQAGPFIPVQINEDLTFDFDDRFEFVHGHYAFLVDDATFDAVMATVLADEAIPYGSGPGNAKDRQINHHNGGRGVYVVDPDGHSYEFFTTVPF